MNGASLLSGNVFNMERFRSPNPVAHRGFGTTAAGVGNVVTTTPENEILVGEFGGDVDSEVVFVDPLTGNALQTIADPDAQKGGNFGNGIAPIGDINGDGFLDIAVGAGKFDRSGLIDVGRVYILRSNNTAPPVVEPPTQDSTASGRTIDLVVSPARIQRGDSARLDGTLESHAGTTACQADQEVEIQSRARAATRYTTIARVRTSADGAFSTTAAPTRSSYYRARVAETASCLGTVSPRERVNVAPSVALVTRTTRPSSTRAIHLQIDCRTEDGPCSGTVKLRTVTRLAGSRRTLPTMSFRAPGNAPSSVTVRVSRHTAALLRRTSRVKATTTVVARDAHGIETRTVGQVTIRTR